MGWQPSNEWTAEERLRLIGRIAQRAVLNRQHLMRDKAELIYRLTNTVPAILELERSHFAEYFGGEDGNGKQGRTESAL